MPLGSGHKVSTRGGWRELGGGSEIFWGVLGGVRNFSKGVGGGGPKNIWTLNYGGGLK